MIENNFNPHQLSGRGILFTPGDTYVTDILLCLTQFNKFKIIWADEGYAGNMRFGNMAGRRINPQLFVRYQQQSGLDFYY